MNLQSAANLFGTQTLAPSRAVLALLAQVVHVEQSNSHSSKAHAKLRGEISGGGKKPWRQKGTGRARAGSSRSPLWRGGGVTHGPRSERNHERSLSQTTKISALGKALLLKAAENTIHSLDSLPSDGKTKSLTSLNTERTLLILETKNEALNRAARNLPALTVRSVAQVTAAEVLSSRRLVGTVAGLTQLAVRARLVAASDAVNDPKPAMKTTSDKETQ